MVGLYIVLLLEKVRMLLFGVVMFYRLLISVFFRLVKVSEEVLYLKSVFLELSALDMVQYREPSYSMMFLEEKPELRVARVVRVPVSMLACLS